MIRRRLMKEERGFTLIELLVASSLMLIVLSATLTSFNTFVNTNHRNSDLTDLTDSVRTTMDRMDTQLRNLANPTSGGVSTINYASNSRMVFQTTDPSRQWVSYCLNTSTKIVWYQISTKSSVATQSAAACPSRTGTTANPNTTCGGVNDDWNCGVEVGPNITNASRPIFAYADANGAAIDASAGLSSGSATSKITRVTVSLFVDNDPAKSPAEVNLQTGAFMRNQNQPPVAAFNVFKTGTTFTFDGGQSDDPEDRTLNFFWYRESGVPTSGQMPGNASGHTIQGDLPNCDTVQSAAIGGLTWTCIGTGVVLQSNFSGLTSPQNAWLMVVDPGSLATLSDVTGGAASPTSCPALATSPPPVTFCRALTFP